MTRVVGLRALAASLAAWLMVGCGPGDSEDTAAGSESGQESSEGDASSSEGGDSTGEPPQASLLEQCDAPTPCDAFSLDPGSGGDTVDPALECALAGALDSIAQPAALELSSAYCDIGCTGTDLLIVGDGSVYVQSWYSTSDSTFAAIEHCTLQPASFFEPCVGEPWSTGTCSNYGGWATDCMPVDAVTCP